MDEQVQLLTAIRDILTRIEKTMQELKEQRDGAEKNKSSK